jgi:hypothetical protein
VGTKKVLYVLSISFKGQRRTRHCPFAFYSPGVAPCTPYPRLWWLRRRDPPLGSLLSDNRHTSKIPNCAIIVRRLNFTSIARRALSTRTAKPRATFSQAHDSNVWALTFHPLAHVLVSTSNDHVTRF